jgi:Zn-dependent protease/CBS domain-containing protein
VTRATKTDRGQSPIGGIPLGSILGIRLAADWSVLVIFALVAIQLGMGALPAWHPTWSVGLRWGVALGAAALFFVSIVLHELSHSLVAKASGLAVRGITLFVFGGISQIEDEAPSPKAEFFIAIVGPLTSFVLGVAGLFGASALGASALTDATTPEAFSLAMASLRPGATLLLWLGLMNLLLGVFNMVPGYPLDGGRVLRSIFWWRTGNLEKATRWAARVGQGVAILLIAWGVAWLFADPIAGIWRILIGWFLFSAARASYQQVQIHELLSHVSVRRMMRTGSRTVAPDLPIAQLVREYLMGTDQRCFPVMDEGEHLRGIVCLADVRGVPEPSWEATPVKEIMTPADELSTVEPDAAAEEALKALGTRDIDQVPVMEGDRLVGVLRRQDLVRWLSLHASGPTLRASR